MYDVLLAYPFVRNDASYETSAAWAEAEAPTTKLADQVEENAEKLHNAARDAAATAQVRTCIYLIGSRSNVGNGRRGGLLSLPSTNSNAVSVRRLLRLPTRDAPTFKVMSLRPRTLLAMR